MQGRQGAGRAQAGCRGRAQRAGQGCKIPFSGFQGLKTSKSRFCNFLRRKGKGGAGQHRARAKARAKGRAGCRAGRAQAGQPPAAPSSPFLLKKLQKREIEKV